MSPRRVSQTDATLLAGEAVASTPAAEVTVLAGRYEILGAAFETRPTRAESLCYLAAYLREKNRICAAYPFARVAADIPRPADTLFIDEAVYAWRAADELAVSAYWMGRYAEARAINEALLAGTALPEAERPRVAANLEFCLAKPLLVFDATRPSPSPERDRPKAPPLPSA